MSMFISVSDLVLTTQGNFIVFVVITLLVTGRPNIRAAEAKQGKCYEGFVCENGECINGYGVCDGIANCSDGSDEIQPICINISCPANSFRCAYGACIDPSLKCNGRYDCADHSDELSSSCGLQWLTNESTPCSKDEFQCRNGECIPGTSLCDGEVNCSDRSDESILACYGGKMSFICPLGSFKCAYGGCISSTKRCDFKEDCADGSDEHYLLCNRPKPQTISPTKCVEGSFRCDDGACVDGVTRCDGKMDCADNSDEKSCSGSVTRPRPRPRPPPPPTTLTTSPTWTITHKPTTVPQQIPVNSCSFPIDQPGTHFVLRSCNCRSSFVHPSDSLLMTCSPGYVPFYENGYNIATCNNGTLWPKEQRCVRVCSKLTDTHSVSYKCTKDGVETGCDGTARPGSKMKMECQNGYNYPGHREVREMEGTCGEDGIWENVNDFDCTHDCGRLFKSPLPLIAQGSNVSSISEYPWHAGIYSWKDNSWNQDCGGTIISAYFILTAAHCVKVKGVRRVPSQLRIAVGKYFRNFEIQISEERTAIILKVQKIHIPPSFSGDDTNYYVNDIAIVEVVEPIRFSEAVKPACIIGPNDKPRNLNGKSGHVVGWGRDENGRNTEPLKSAILPYISNSDCSSYPNVTSLARDKFCAFLTNGTRVLEGDSGGGLTFEFNGSHFVYGIVSVNIQNTVVSAFTDVTYPDNRKFLDKHRIHFDEELKINNRNRG